MNREGYSGEVMKLRWKTEKLCTQNKALYMMYIAKKVTGFKFLFTRLALDIFTPPPPAPLQGGGRP